MFDTKEELRKWKEELVAERRELLIEHDRLFNDGTITEEVYSNLSKLSDQISILTMKIYIVDREYQMCGGDQDDKKADDES